MSISDISPDGHSTPPTKAVIHKHAKQSQRGRDADNEELPIDTGERRLMIRGAIFLSVLGVIAFLITGQVAVVVAMNSPLLAIIGKEYFLRHQ